MTRDLLMLEIAPWQVLVMLHAVLIAYMLLAAGHAALRRRWLPAVGVVMVAVWVYSVARETYTAQFPPLRVRDALAACGFSVIVFGLARPGFSARKPRILEDLRGVLVRRFGGSGSRSTFGQSPPEARQYRAGAFVIDYETRGKTVQGSVLRDGHIAGPGVVRLSRGSWRLVSKLEPTGFRLVAPEPGDYKLEIIVQYTRIRVPDKLKIQA
jgi:hypothetical protein